MENENREEGMRGRLSERLEKVALLVSPGNRLADIGTDHGFVPIFLVEEKRVPSAIAMDVNRGPLERAAAHIKKHGLEALIETRLSDGLQKLEQGEADTVLMAGMGGALTERILETDLARAEVGELVLQPQSHLAKVRLFLEKNGWRIDREEMVFEEGKFYPMLLCHPGKMVLSAEEAQYGPCLIDSRDPVLLQYLNWQEGILKSNLKSLEQARETLRTQDRILQLKEQLLCMEKVRSKIV